MGLVAPRRHGLTAPGRGSSQDRPRGGPAATRVEPSPGRPQLASLAPPGTDRLRAAVESIDSGQSWTRSRNTNRGFAVRFVRAIATGYVMTAGDAHDSPGVPRVTATKAPDAFPVTLVIAMPNPPFGFSPQEAMITDSFPKPMSGRSGGGMTPAWQYFAHHSLHVSASVASSYPSWARLAVQPSIFSKEYSTITGVFGGVVGSPPWLVESFPWGGPRSRHPARRIEETTRSDK